MKFFNSAKCHQYVLINVMFIKVQSSLFANPPLPNSEKSTLSQILLANSPF